jgi:1-acyl-sn-glycerol-3-phosphate acyltransferase
MTVSGLEHLPTDGPVLLVARHYHHLFDGVVLLLSMPRPIHILVTVDWVKNSYARRLMTLATTMAHWPVIRRSYALRACGNPGPGQRTRFSISDTKRYQHRALCNSVELLARDCMLVVFPEGYPNIDPHDTPKTRPEEFLPFKSGFTAIAATAEKRLGARVPIVPSGFRYTKNKRWTARLNIGEAVYLEDFLSRQLLLSYI